MFERFTERARQVVVLAQDEARSLRHNYIGTEHLLLGLMREEEGIAARVLASLDVTLEQARADVARIVGLGEEVTSGQIPFTPRAKKVLELALREGLSLGHNYIGTEHVLLGLAREGEGTASEILLEHGVDSERVRDEVLRLLSGPRRFEEPAPELQPTSPPFAPEFLEELGSLDKRRLDAIEAQKLEDAAHLSHRQRRLARAADQLQRAWEGREDEPREPPKPRIGEAHAVARAVVPRRGTRRSVFLGHAASVVPFLSGALVLGAGLLVGWLIWG